MKRGLWIIAIMLTMIEAAWADPPVQQQYAIVYFGTNVYLFDDTNTPLHERVLEASRIVADTLDLAGTRAMTGNVVTLARDIKSRDAVSVGDYGAAFGVGTTAGEYGAAFGYATMAGFAGAAIGYGTTAGYAGAAFGNDTTAGDYGAAFGNSTVAGDYGAAFGYGASAGNYGFAAGEGTSAGDHGFAAGLETSAGYYGFAAGAGTSAGNYGFAAGREAKGADGSFVFADNSTGGTPFNRTNRPNEFAARAAGGTYFDTPLFTVMGEVAVESNLVVGNGQVFLNSSGTSWLQLDGTNLMFRATNGVIGTIQMTY